MLRSTRRDRGGALVVICALLLLLVGMAFAVLRSTSTTKRSTVKGQQYDRALDVAEGGIDYTIDRMNHWTGGAYSTLTTTLGPGTAVVTVTPTFAGTVGTYTLHSTGTVGGTSHTITVVVHAVFSSVWQYGLFSNQTLNLSSHELSDSWVSGPPPPGTSVYDSSGNPRAYDTQAVNHLGPHTYALANGSDGSNGNVVFSNSNNYIFGNAVPGPGGSVTLDGAYVSGSTSPAASSFPFPAITVPTVSGPPGTLGVATGASATIPPGTYHFASITTASNSTLTLNGPATIVVDDLSMSSNTSFSMNTSGGPIVFYGTGPFVMASNSSTLGPSSGVPSDLQVYITTGNYPGPGPNVGFSSNNALVGAVYAPNALVNLPSNYQAFGSVVAQDLGPASNFQVHYDQNLAGVGGAPVYKMTAWYENPADQ